MRGESKQERGLYAEFKERMRMLAEESVVIERCASCPDFEIEAPLAEARGMFRQHVAEVHPERLAALSVKRMPMKIVPSTNMNAESLLGRILNMKAAA